MSESPWIPVDEMLPEYLEVVLIWQQRKPWTTKVCSPRFQSQMAQAYLREGFGWVVHGSQGLENVVAGIAPNVTHWMPLPPAPPGQKYWTLEKSRM